MTIAFEFVDLRHVKLLFELSPIFHHEPNPRARFCVATIASDRLFVFPPLS